MALAQLPATHGRQTEHSADVAPLDNERALRRLKLSDRTLPWVGFRRLIALHYEFRAPIEGGYRYSAMPDELAPRYKGLLLSGPDPSKPGVTQASTDWYRGLHIKFSKRYTSDGIERFFRPHENALLAQERRRTGHVQCAITNGWFQVGERGPLSPISEAGASLLRVRRSRANSAIEKRLNKPAPPQKRGDENWYRCPCCFLWIDLTAMKRRLQSMKAIRRSPHVLRNHRGDNELLRLPDEQPHLFVDGSYSRLLSDQPPTPMFGSIADLPVGKFEIDGVPLDGATWKDAWIYDALRSSRGKHPKKKARRLPPRLCDDDHYAQAIVSAVAEEAQNEPGNAPSEKLRNKSLLVKAWEERQREAVVLDEDVDALEATTVDAGVFQTVDRGLMHDFRPSKDFLSS